MADDTETLTKHSPVETLAEHFELPPRRARHICEEDVSQAADALLFADGCPAVPRVRTWVGLAEHDRALARDSKRGKCSQPRELKASTGSVRPNNTSVVQMRWRLCGINTLQPKL